MCFNHMNVSTSFGVFTVFSQVAWVWTCPGLSLSREGGEGVSYTAASPSRVLIPGSLVTNSRKKLRFVRGLALFI